MSCSRPPPRSWTCSTPARTCTSARRTGVSTGASISRPIAAPPLPPRQAEPPADSERVIRTVGPNVMASVYYFYDAVHERGIEPRVVIENCPRAVDVSRRAEFRGNAR